MHPCEGRNHSIARLWLASAGGNNIAGINETWCDRPPTCLVQDFVYPSKFIILLLPLKRWPLAQKREIVELAIETTTKACLQAVDAHRPHEANPQATSPLIPYPVQSSHEMDQRGFGLVAFCGSKPEKKGLIVCWVFQWAIFVSRANKKGNRLLNNSGKNNLKPAVPLSAKEHLQQNQGYGLTQCSATTWAQMSQLALMLIASNKRGVNTEKTSQNYSLS